MTENNDEISILNFCYSLIKQKKTLLAPPMIFGVLAICISLMLPKQYESISSWMPSAQNTDSGFSGLASLAGISLNKSENENQLLPDLILSDAIFSKIHKTQFPFLNTDTTLNLIEYLNIEDKAQGLDSLGRELLIKEKILAFLTNNVTLEIGTLIEMTVLTKDPLFSKTLNLFLSQEIIALASKIKTQKVTRNREFLETQYKLYSDSLIENEEELLGFSLANTSTNSPTLALLRARLMRKTEIFQTITLEVRKQLEVARLEEKKESGPITFINTPSLARQPLYPKKKLIVIVSVFLGGVFGLTFAVFKVWWLQKGRNELELIKTHSSDF